ncbi:hypothetical protein LWF15_30460 [Kineosporia rhizophila]|uniref:hypothetical protein n=1 Tax=Kineosporia TaxID=49184 RepID=UPI001E4C4540|nr:MULTISPECIES: hypothetical protein [Kineosporia]MCE0539828.1 hypothetical protein [Kineosporia rhizophila]GLY13418.1 hypothetical protein Kisp01_04340 [Kineosporia sp. NBRC 101677]
MASDIMGRRQIMQQRLDRVRDLELAIREQVAIIAESAGMTVEQLDFDGSFRASLASLASLAARRPTFDVVLALPTAPAGVRIQQLHNQVRVQVIAHEDGPYRPGPPPAPAPMTVPAPQAPVSPVNGTPLAQPQPAAAATSPYDTAPVSITQIAAATTLPPSPPPARPSEPLHEDLVASDLAALLWEGLSDPQYDERV